MATTTFQKLNASTKIKENGARKADGKKPVLRVVSLFSGSGGMDLGFERAGFDVVWANDVNHWACETFRKNFKGEIVEASIADVREADVPECEVITGGFPCQDFSMIWKRMGLKTERGNLYRHFVRIVIAKQAKMFVA